jgi:two-component sensor histidine kinase
MAPLMLGEATRLEEGLHEDFERRIAALISIHDMLSWTETKDLVSSRTYFWLLADALRRVTAAGIGTLVSTYDSDEDPRLPVDRATTIGLVVYELVVNSAKHAHGLSIRMDLRVAIEGETLVLRYSDHPALIVESGAEEAAEDTPPYGEASRGKTKGGLGRELVSALLSRARGERCDDGSTPHRFEARFPLD